MDQEKIHHIDGGQSTRRAWIRPKTGLVPDKKAGHKSGRNQRQRDM